MAAAKVYIDQLFKRKLGRPLWDPDLCEVYVGDVGYFDQKDNRNFRRLFNVLVDVDDALNKRGVPEGFQPLEIDPELNVTYGPQVWTPGYCLMTSTVTASDAAFKPITIEPIPINVGISYKCSKDLGALLLLRGNTPCVDTEQTNGVEEYIEENIDSWYAFAWSRFSKKVVPEGSIVLVRGCSMSDSWALASFANRSKEASLFFNGGIYSGAGSVEIRGQWSKATASSADWREGDVLKPGDVPKPSHYRNRNNANSAIWRKLGLEDPEDNYQHPELDVLQTSSDCVFIRSYRIRRRFLGIRIPLRIEAQAGPHQLPSRSPSPELIAPLSAHASPPNGDDSIRAESPTEMDMIHQPLDHLLDYMFETAPDAKLAIATDDDLYNLIEEDSDFDHIDTVIRAKLPEVRLNSQMTACIQAPLRLPMPDEYYEVDPPNVRPPLIASTERVAASERTITNVDASLKDLRKLIEDGYAIAEQLHECIPDMNSHPMMAESLAQRVSDCSTVIWNEIMATPLQTLPIPAVELSMKKILKVNAEILQEFERMASAEFGMSRMLDSNEDMYILSDLEERLDKALDHAKSSIAGLTPDTASLEPLGSAPKSPEIEDPDGLGLRSTSDRISSPASLLRRGQDEYDITSDLHSSSQVL